MSTTDKNINQDFRIFGSTNNTAVYALLIRNSDSASLLSVRNDGRIDLGGFTIASGSISGTSASFSGNISVSGTVDTVDIAARDAVLTSTTSTATANSSNIASNTGNITTNTNNITANASSITTNQATANAALPRAGGLMSGAIQMGTNKITGLGNPTGAQDGATKTYVDTAIGTIPAGLTFEGNWNASTDSPSLAGTTPANGIFYIVSVNGSTNLSGITDWKIGDWAVYVSNGSGTDAWQKVDNTSTLSGAGVSGQLAYWNGTTVLTGNSNATFDGTNLTIGGRVEAGSLDINGNADISGSLTMSGSDILMQDELIDFKTNGSVFVAQFTGKRASTDLDSRQWNTEGGWAYTTFDSATTNRPSDGINNANGLLSFNTHGGGGTANYMHQIAMTSNNKLWHRNRNGSSFGAWNEIAFMSKVLPLTGGTLTGSLNGTTGNFSGSLTTGYGVALNGGAVNYLLYGNTGDSNLYLRDMNNSAMITSWSPTAFRVHKNLTVSGTTNLVGNLGIGTTNPIDNLNIYDADDNVGILIQTATSGTAAGDGFRVGMNNSHAFLWNYENTPMAFATNGSEKATILANGNFGIGTNSPSEKLEVAAGAAAILIDSTTNEASLKYDNSTTTANIKLANNDLKIELGGSEKLRILANGNVGIGLTNPNNKLMVSGDISMVNNFSSFKFGTTGGDGNWGAPKMTRIGSSIVISDFSGVKLGGYDGTEYNARMTVLGTGNVGIGTQNPGSLLHINKENATATFEIEGGLTTITAADQVHSEINFGANDASVTGGISGSIKSIADISNGAHNGLAFYTGQQSRTPYLQRAMQIRNTGGISFGPTASAYGSSGQILKSNGDASPTWVSASTVIGGPYLPLGGGILTGTLGMDAAIDIKSGSAIHGTITTSSSSLTLNARNTGIMLFQSGGSEKMRIHSGGQLLVGNTSGGYSGTKIQVGNFTDSQNGINILTSTTGYGYVLFGDGAGADTYRGQITYYHGDDSMMFNTNGAERLRIASSGNVGIGTAAPDNKLMIESTSDSMLRLTRTGVRSWRQNIGSTGNFIIRDLSGPADRLTINTVGNVGIGTTAPARTLSVYGDALIESSGLTASLYFRPSATYSTNGIQTMKVIGSGNPYHTITSFSNYDASNVLNINHDKVGIGTTTPSEKLEVFGKAIIRKSGSATAHGDTDLLVTDSTAASSTAAIQILGGNAGFSNLQFSDTNSYSQGAIIYGHTDNYMAFKANASEKMRILANGNVGIGTTTPAVKLDFGANTGKAFHLYGDSGGDYYGFNMLQYDGGPFSTNIFSGNNGEIKLRTAAGTTTQTTRLTVKANGNIGIGTVSPSEALQVVGNISLSGTLKPAGVTIKAGASATSVSELGFANSYGTAFLKSSYTNPSSITQTYLAFHTNATGDANGTLDEAMRIAGHNVGIGTVSPTEKLHVIGKILSQEGSVYSQFNASGQDTIIANSGTGSVRFFNAGAEKMRLAAAGELLLGQTSAADAHFVVNSGTWAPSKPLLRLNNGFYNYMFGFHSRQSVSHSFQIYANSTIANINWNSGILKIGTQASSDLSFYTADTTRMTITDDGKVGIGSTNPVAKLESISPDGNINSLRIGRADNSNYWDFNHAGNDLRIFNGSSSGSDILLGVNPGSTGTNNKVGIGIATPTAKLHVAGTGQFTSQVTIPATPTASTHAASKGYIDGLIAGRPTQTEVNTNTTNIATNNTNIAANATGISRSLAKTGGAMTGPLTTNSTIDGRDVAADGVLATNALPKGGGTMTGNITMGGNTITGTGAITGATINGELRGTINSTTTAVTQGSSDNTTKVATTAYVTTAVSGAAAGSSVYGSFTPNSTQTTNAGGNIGTRVQIVFNTAQITASGVSVNSTGLSVSTAGLYQVSFNFASKVSGTANRTMSGAELEYSTGGESWTVIPGTRVYNYNRGTGAGGTYGVSEKNSANASFIQSMAVNSYIRARFWIEARTTVLSGVTTEINGCRLSVHKIN